MKNLVTEVFMSAKIPSRPPRWRPAPTLDLTSLMVRARRERDAQIGDAIARLVRGVVRGMTRMLRGR
jgi:hypothetical protein